MQQNDSKTVRNNFDYDCETVSNGYNTTNAGKSFARKIMTRNWLESLLKKVYYMRDIKFNVNAILKDFSQ